MCRHHLIMFASHNQAWDADAVAEALRCADLMGGVPQVLEGL